MSTFLSYGVPGIPYGCDFALMAVGLVLTFRATGVFNLAFGAQAFAAAFIFDLLVRTNGLPVWLAFIISVLLISPLLGVALDRFLFRHIPSSSTTAKLVSSVGLLIAIPQSLPIFFGSTPRLNPPSLWLNPNVVYFHLFTTPVNGGEISTTVVTVVVVAALVAMFRWTGIGLQMRAVVESRRMAQLEGINSPNVAAAAWALSSVLAGLAGVLMLPLTAELSATVPLQFTSLLVAGITAAAIAGMRSIPIALVAAIGLGIVENLLKGYLPSGGVLAQTFVPAFPFIVLVGTLLFNPALRGLDISSDPLAACDPPPAPPAVSIRDRRLDKPTAGGLLDLRHRLPGVVGHLGSRRVGDVVRRGPHLVDHLPVDHAHHRHERSAVVVPGDLRRRGGVRRRPARDASGPALAPGGGRGRRSWPPPPGPSWPSWPSACRACC